MTFDELKERSSDDLKAVAGYMLDAADNIAAGDMRQMDILLDKKLPLWFDMLRLRYAYAQEELS